MKTLILILCMLGVGIATTGHAGFDITGWNWQRPIDILDFSGFVRVSIPPEVFNEGQPSLNDLRVLDEENSLIPHIIHWGRIREVRPLEWRLGRLVNATFVPGKYSRVSVDFGETAEKNIIQVSLSGQNYRRRALLEGSNDTKTWEIVAEELWLFDVRVEGQNFKVDTLRFPTNNFPYLRLTVYNMVDDPRRITIESVKGAFQRIEMEKELVQVPVKQMAVSHREDKKQSIIEVDLGFRNLPVVSLQSVVTTSYFYRGYELYGRNELKEKVPRRTETGSDFVEREAPWIYLQRGVLYRTHHQNKIGESLKMEELNAPFRHLKLCIFNGDNPPLEVSRVSLYRRETSLIFQAQAGKRYTLVGGNLKVAGPDYDLAKSVQGLDEMKLPAVSLGSPIFMAHKEKLPPWTERYSIFIWIVLIIAVGVTVGLIFRNLKKLPPSQEQQ